MSSLEPSFASLTHAPQALPQLASKPPLRSKRPAPPVARPEEASSLLDVYLAEVHRHPLLTREEEISLARRVRQSGDRDARIRLVSSHLRLVVKMAREHLRPPLVLMDLIQEGNLGLVHAVERFDPERGVTLLSETPLSLEAIGQRFGVSRERARQVEARLLQRLRDFLRRRLPDFDWLRAAATPGAA